MTRDEITRLKTRRYRRVWGLFLQLPMRAVAKREGVTVNRIRQIVQAYARIRQRSLVQQSGDIITGRDWTAKYEFLPIAVNSRVSR